MEKKKAERNLLEEKSFEDQINAAVKDLNYVSETDSEFFFFSGKAADEVSAKEILKQTEREDSVEERNFYGFFGNLTRHQAWFGKEQNKTAERFADLRKLLAVNLVEKKVFKIGKVNVDIYIVGLDGENILTGIWTKAVET
ncbi:MAG: nuclease A inhibitor family protein [Pyrinomonadaceae bacterium]